MDCTRFERLHDLHLDGRLAAADAARLEEHVARCPACAGRRELDLRIRSALAPEARGFGPPAPGALVDRIAAACRPSGPASPAGARPFSRRSFALAASVLIAVLGAAGGWLAGRAGGRVAAATGLELDAVDRTLGLTDAQRREFESLIRGFEGRREALRREIEPRLGAIDDEERASLWRLLTEDQRARLQSHDPALARQLREGAQRISDRPR